MTSQELRHAPPLAPGYWYVNVARVDQTPDWRVQPKPPGGSPNDEPTLFGYDAKEFMAKQYRRRHGNP